MKSQIIQLIQAQRIVAIVRLDDLSQAVSISQALAAGGLVVQEFTLTNPQALKAMREVKRALSTAGTQAAIGIGSVRNMDEVQAAIQAEADFVVSPITNPHIIERCVRSNVAVMPGAFSPTEIASAWDAGADMVKVFPARGLGPGYIKDILAPMPYLKLMPTGGIDLSNIHSYFAAGAVAVGIGGNLLDKNAIARGEWQTLTAAARQYAETVVHE